MKSSVEKIIASSDTDSKLAIGVMVNGETLPADFVIMGVGVAPATAFLKDSAISLERDGGIKVDEYLKVPGLDGVYAIGEEPVRMSFRKCPLTYCIAGDIAHFPQINGESRRIEHWNVCLALLVCIRCLHLRTILQVAGNHGRAVGRTIAGGKKPLPFSKIPIFWSARTQLSFL
jgi:hypothetical protein